MGSCAPQAKCHSAWEPSPAGRAGRPREPGPKPYGVLSRERRGLWGTWGQPHSGPLPLLGASPGLAVAAALGVQQRAGPLAPSPVPPPLPPSPRMVSGGVGEETPGFPVSVGKGCGRGGGLPSSFPGTLPLGGGQHGVGLWGGDSRAVSTAGPGVATPTRLRAESPVLSQTLLPGPQRAAPGGRGTRGTSAEGQRRQHVSEPGPRA